MKLLPVGKKKTQLVLHEPAQGGQAMALTLIVLLLILLAGMAVLALAFLPIGPGPKGRNPRDTEG